MRKESPAEILTNTNIRLRIAGAHSRALQDFEDLLDPLLQLFVRPEAYALMSRLLKVVSRRETDDFLS